MDILKLLSELRESGVQLSLHGETLKLKSPPNVLTNEIKTRLKENKPAIIQFLRDSEKGAGSHLETIPKRELKGKLPLSFSQQGLWLHSQLHPDSTAYNMLAGFNVSGDLDYQVLHRVITEIVRRHESLRSRFLQGEDGNPHMRVSAAGPCQVEIIDKAVSLECSDILVREEIKKRSA